MKTLFNKITFLCILAASCVLTGCSNDHDEWENGDPALAHVYYYCFEKWGGIPGGNDISYSVEQGETIAIPTQFYSSFTRSYSPIVYYYTSAWHGKLSPNCNLSSSLPDRTSNFSPE